MSLTLIAPFLGHLPLQVTPAVRLCFSLFFNLCLYSFFWASFVFRAVAQGRLCSEQAEPAMFSVRRWQLDQNSCLPNDNVLCTVAAALAAAAVWVLQDLGWTSAGVLTHPRSPGLAVRDAPSPLRKPWGRCGRGDGFWLAVTGAVRPAWEGDPAEPRSYPFKASGAYCTKQGEEKKTFPQQKVRRRSESGSLYCRSPEREGGAGFELPAARSELLYKEPPSLASEIQ